MKFIFKDVKTIYKLAYHGTKTEKARQDILSNGFNTYSVFLNTKKYDAEGYGQFVIAINISSLNIYTLSQKELNSANPYDKSKYYGYDGIAYNYGGGRGTNIEIFDVAKLNRCIKKEAN